MRPLAERMADDSYDGYAYAYPHKTAYRPLSPSVPLAEAWADEDRAQLFLYVHLPFCEMRCGFCNLFTTVRPGAGLVEETLAAIDRQSRQVAAAVRPIRIAQAAFGGGTPSFLDEAQLETLFSSLRSRWPVDWHEIPLSFEVSPGTITPRKLSLLRDLGVDRVSMGVQSFVAADLKALGRPQPAGQLEEACEMIAQAGFPTFNIDLIYGNDGQDEKRWRRSLERALSYAPGEIYLYPLYVGRLTGLDRRGRRPAERRRALYRQARELLTQGGYQQISMRLFRKGDDAPESQYSCQEDGMIGLGPGARSYTRALHYSSEYAVGQSGVRRIIEDFCRLHQYDHASYGVALSPDEERIRFVLKSLLRASGLSRTHYSSRFGSSVEADMPRLREVVDLGLANWDADALRLTAEGLAWSDTIGPWLYSDEMTARMGEFQLS